MSRRVAALFTAVIMLIASGSVFAETFAGDAVMALIRAEDTRLADVLGEVTKTQVSAQDVANYHAEGLGYGEVSKAYGLASLSGKSVNEIMAMKKTRGWGEIAHELGVKVSDVTRHEETVDKVLEEKEEGNARNKDDKDKEHKLSVNDDANSNKGGHRGGHGGKGGKN